MFTIIVTLSSEILNTVDQVNTKSIKPEFCNYAGYVVMSLLWSEVFCKVSHKFVGKPSPDFYSRCWPDLEANGELSESELVEKFKFSEIFEIRPKNQTWMNYLGCSNYKIVDTTHPYFNQEQILKCSGLKGLVQQGLYCVETDDWDQSDAKILVSNGFSSFISEAACLSSCATLAITLFLVGKFSLLVNQGSSHQPSLISKIVSMIWIIFNFYATFWVAKSRLEDNLNDLVDTIVGGTGWFWEWGNF